MCNSPSRVVHIVGPAGVSCVNRSAPIVEPPNSDDPILIVPTLTPNAAPSIDSLFNVPEDPVVTAVRNSRREFGKAVSRRHPNRL